MYDKLKHIKILFLEDNKLFAENTIKLLEFYFNSIIHKTNMKEALEIFKTQDIGMIISDLKVDDGNALTFIEQIRSINDHIPIVVLSAHKDEEFLLKSIPLNLTAYSLKPLDFDEFKLILKKCELQINKTMYNIEHITDTIFYDFNQKIITIDNINIELRQREVLFIELLIKNKQKIISKDEIAQEIWGDEFMTESALKNFLLRVRQKVGKKLFINIQGLGWRLA